MLKPGDAAPDFVLKETDGNDVRLSSFSGRPIILFFYPKDNTLGCTIETKGFREHHEGMTRYDAIVVGVSMDADHTSFRDKHGIPFLLLSDPDGRVHDLYEAWHTTLLGKRPLAVRRCTYLIDEDGIIRKSYPRVNVLRHARHVLKDLDRLRAQRQWGRNAEPRLKDLMP